MKNRESHYFNLARPSSLREQWNHFFSRPSKREIKSFITTHKGQVSSKDQLLELYFKKKAKELLGSDFEKINEEFPNQFGSIKLNPAIRRFELIYENKTLDDHRSTQISRVYFWKQVERRDNLQFWVFYALADYHKTAVSVQSQHWSTTPNTKISHYFIAFLIIVLIFLGLGTYVFNGRLWIEPDQLVTIFEMIQNHLLVKEFLVRAAIVFMTILGLFLFAVKKDFIRAVLPFKTPSKTDFPYYFLMNYSIELKSFQEKNQGGLLWFSLENPFTRKSIFSSLCCRDFFPASDFVHLLRDFSTQAPPFDQDLQEK